jgi:hypothetical protein
MQQLSSEELHDHLRCGPFTSAPCWHSWLPSSPFAWQPARNAAGPSEPNPPCDAYRCRSPAGPPHSPQPAQGPTRARLRARWFRWCLPVNRREAFESWEVFREGFSNCRALNRSTPRLFADPMTRLVTPGNKTLKTGRTRLRETPSLPVTIAKKRKSPHFSSILPLFTLPHGLRSEWSRAGLSYTMDGFQTILFSRRTQPNRA